MRKSRWPKNEHRDYAVLQTPFERFAVSFGTTYKQLGMMARRHSLED